MAPGMGETQPLLRVVEIRPAQPRPRYTNHRVRRFCSLLLAALCLTAFGYFVVDVALSPAIDDGDQHRFPWPPRWPWSNGISYRDLQQIMLDTPSTESLRDSNSYYAHGMHLAGKNRTAAEWTRDYWIAQGLEAELVEYEVYINYPLSHRLALLETKGKGKNKETKVAYEAKLEEDVLDEDPTTQYPNRVPTFQGYSANGNVTAQYVFVNYGTQYDFNDLVESGIDLKSKIAIVKHARNFRGLKVKMAQELGMVGVIIYDDPGEDGVHTIENGVEPYPHGFARQPSSVQRGSVQFLSTAPGDPTTPGYPSKPGVPRADANFSIPSIPSIPISYEDAIPLLKALNGHGPPASSFNKWWQQGGLGYRGVKYNVGPSPKGVELNLVNEQEYVITPIWDVIGSIKGSSKETVMIGNHRDAWIIGGAQDPNSGSACLNEVARSFGAALKRGWRPMRTIMLGSWDGEEYGLLGSTEWVEDHISFAKKDLVAYLNLDDVSTGSLLKIGAAPLLLDVMRESAKLVPFYNRSTESADKTLYELWNGRAGTLGSGSDYTAFLVRGGVPSLDYAFVRTPDAPVFHYHSNFDSFYWTDRFGDPGFHSHEAMTKLWALSTVMLVDSPVIQFRAGEYHAALETYLVNVTMTIDSVDSKKKKGDFEVEKARQAVKKIGKAVHTFGRRASVLDAHNRALTEQFLKDGAGVPWYRWWRRARTYRLVRALNARYMQIERSFIHPDGLDNRPWYQHTVFAPGRWTGYAGATFPGLVESIEDRNTTDFLRWADIIHTQIQRAATVMFMPDDM